LSDGKPKFIFARLMKDEAPNDVLAGLRARDEMLPHLDAVVSGK
jgi:hypothetical protein